MTDDVDIGPLPIEDPNGIFPALDGIQPVGPSDVPPGFDLTAILSESMRARPQWRDLAAAASRIVYEFVERGRLALMQSRDPSVLARPLKITTLKMCGLDWTSDLLLDSDYDRVLEAVSQFQQQKGSHNFAQFIGYALGVPMELVTLWNQAPPPYTVYGPFMPGKPMVQNGTVYDVPPGLGFPTAHVDLLYEYFAPRSGPIAGATAELTDLFYRIAPIHLVLDAIAAEVTISVGDLRIGLSFFETGECTLVVESPATATLTTAGATLLRGGVAGGVALTGAQVSTDNVITQVTTLPDVVVSLPAEVTGVTVVDATTVLIRVTLDPTVGTFVIGTVGVLVGGTLLAYASFPQRVTKTANDLPVQVGDVRRLAMRLTVPDSSVFGGTALPILS